MTSIEAGAWLTGAVFLKGTLITLGALTVARVTQQKAARASLMLTLGFAALLILPLVDALIPDLSDGFLTVRHEAVREIRIGALAASPASILVAIWAVGAVIMMWRFVCDVHAAMAMAQRAERKAQRGRIAELLLSARRAVGCDRLPETRETSELATVALIGFRRPVLLIPVQAREWSDEELFGILCHELEHVRRGDWLMLMLERIVAAVYWPNPLIHLAGRAAATTRELAADDAAMRSGAGAQAYAERLIAVARDLRTAPRLAVSVAFAESGGVDRRVRALFDQRDRQRVSSSTLLRAGLVAIPFFMAVAAVEPWTCLPGPAATSSTTGCP